MTSVLDRARHEVALGNRILANEGILDAFGHVSLRHPGNPGRYLLSRSRAPELVEPADVIEFDLDSGPVKPTKEKLYLERVIHGEIYKARPDVNAVVHHHGPALLPFCITGTPLLPVFHLGAAIGDTVPFWDQHTEFGDTDLLVVKPEEGRSLARALGGHALVLMNRHGATVVGATVQELVFRAIYSCRNAEYQYRAQALGKVVPLHRGEVEKARSIHAHPNVTMRTWDYWTMRLERSGNGLRRRTRSSAPVRKAPHRSGRRR